MVGVGLVALVVGQFEGAQLPVVQEGGRRGVSETRCGGMPLGVLLLPFPRQQPHPLRKSYRCRYALLLLLLLLLVLVV